MTANTGVIAATSVNLRDGPSGEVIGRLDQGAVVRLLKDFDDGWPLVKSGDGDDALVGFVDERFVAWDEARADPGGQPGGGGGPPDGPRFTNNPNERTTTRTPTSFAQMAEGLARAWTDLNATGCKVLIAQHNFETGSGDKCFNFNFGNMKADASVPHMYLKEVWECYSQASAEREIAADPGHVRKAKPSEIRGKSFRCAGVAIIANPPNHISRFAAYASVEEGIGAWVGKFKRYLPRHANLVQILNDGDIDGFISILVSEGYFTGSPSDYAAGVRSIFDHN